MIAISTLALVAPACADEASRLPRVSPATVKRWQAQGETVTIVDVRPPEVFAKDHVPGAVNISDEHQQDAIDRLSHEHPIVVYSSRSRMRAPVAARLLRARGFTNIYVLEGGLTAWRADTHAAPRPSALASSADAPPAP